MTPLFLLEPLHAVPEAARPALQPTRLSTARNRVSTSPNLVPR
jgi:hypothetical protein